MATFVALLRAVNVGGTGKLPMRDLVAMCEAAGLSGARTYIASGNVVFESRLDEAKIKAELEARLAAHAGKSLGVLMRSGAEMVAVLRANPFAGAPGNLTYAIFLDAPPPAETLAALSGRNGEELGLGKREIYVRYPAGMGASRLRIPAAAAGTARNMNTVAALVKLAGVG